MILSVPPGTFCVVPLGHDVGLTRTLAEFVLVDAERAAQRLGDQPIRPNEIAAELFALHGSTRGLVLNVAIRDDGTVVGLIEEHYHVRGGGQDGYDTSDVVAEVSNLDALEACGILALAIKIDETRSALNTFGLTDFAVETTRELLLEGASARVVAERRAVSTALDPSALTMWERRTAAECVERARYDYGTARVRSDQVWNARDVLFRLCELENNQVRAFLSDEVADWTDACPAHDEPRQIAGLLTRLRNPDPLVRSVLESLTA